MVCRRASRNSWTAIWPLSSSSKAEKAERSSVEGERGVRRDESVVRKEDRGRVLEEEGGKNALIEFGSEESPKYG